MHIIRINFRLYIVLVLTTPKIGYLIQKTTKFIAFSASFMNWTCFNPFNVTYLGDDDDRPRFCVNITNICIDNLIRVAWKCLYSFRLEMNHCKWCQWWSTSDAAMVLWAVHPIGSA